MPSGISQDIIKTFKARGFDHSISSAFEADSGTGGSYDADVYGPSGFTFDASRAVSPVPPQKQPPEIGHGSAYERKQFRVRREGDNTSGKRICYKGERQKSDTPVWDMVPLRPRADSFIFMA